MASAQARLSLAYAFVILPSSLGYVVDDPDRETIQFVAIIHRNGRSNPMETYPNDPYINYTWPGGKGSLSPDGSLQMYTLGRTLRRRYYRLFPPDGLYSGEQMNIWSSSTERTLMSCQSFLAGFMPPLATQNPLPIVWQPISIHSIPNDVDNLIQQENPCSKYDAIYSNLLIDPPNELEQFHKNNAEFFGQISKYTGMNITTVWQAEDLYDILLTQQSNNLQLPAWTDLVFPHHLRSMVKRALELRTHTSYMKRIKGGPLITKIVEQMQMKESRASPKRSLSIYCGHNRTLVSIMRALNIIDQTNELPDHGATISFELHCATSYEYVNICNDVYEDDDYCDDFEVKIVYYENENDATPKHVLIPDCPAPCSLERFIKSVEHILVYDYCYACDTDE